MKNCSEIMTSNPIFCLAGDTVDKAVKLMKTEDIGAIPIVDAAATSKLVGILTDRDIVMHLENDGNILNRKIQEIMTPETFTCFEDEDAEKALNTMVSHQVRRVPVVDHASHLKGMITQADVAIRIHDSSKTAKVVEEISRSV